MSEAPTLWLIAGPNGVGKTTFAFRRIRRLSGSAEFVNLDEIARGLAPLAPETGAPRASRVALGMIADLIAGNGRGRRSFSLETTLAGRTHLLTLERAKASHPRTGEGIGVSRPASLFLRDDGGHRAFPDRSPCHRGRP